MNIVFMGTPEFSVDALDALVAAGHKVLAVYSQPPRPAGRGQKEQQSPVHMRAVHYGIPVRTPATLKDEQTQREFAALKADCAVVVAYGLLLPKAILDACPCLNIHASLLPRWRGAAPIQRAIEAGDVESGVTIMQMDVGMDTGPMLLKGSCAITDQTTAASLHDQLKVMGAKLIVQALEQMQAGTLKATMQGEGATHAPKIKKEEAHIQWNRPTKELVRFIHAMNPFPGAYTIVGEEKIKILQVEYRAGKGQPGVVADDYLAVFCQDGIIVPTLVQRAGKKAMSAHECVRGFAVPAGQKLV